MTAHALPEVTKAVSEQAGRIIHSSTLYLNRPMVELAERIATVSGDPRREGLLHHLGHRGQRHRAAAGVVATGAPTRSWRCATATTAVPSRRSRSPATGRGRPTSPVAVPDLLRARRPAVPLAVRGPSRRRVHRRVRRRPARGARPGRAATSRRSSPSRSRASAGSPPARTGCSARSRRCCARTGSCGSPTRCRPAGAAPASTSGAGRRTGRHPGHLDLREGRRQRPVHGRRRSPGVHHGLPRRQLDLDVRRLPADLGGSAGQPALPARPRPAGQRRAAGGRSCSSGLRAIDSPHVGDVRGKGLMIGVELRPGTDDPAPDIANTGAGGARSAGGVLIGKGGLHGNVLRIAPPLSLTRRRGRGGPAALVAAIEEVPQVRTLITGGLVITASDELAVDVLIEDEKVVALRHRPGLDGRHGASTRPASTSSPAASTATPTWRCPSAARSRPTPSRPAPGPPAWGGTTTIVDFAIQSHGRHAARGPGRLARQGRGQLRHRLRLPHDHGRRQRGLAEGDGGAGRRGRHQLQAVHGLPRRALLRRRADAARAAEGRRDRRADPHARRERHRDRRADRAGARPRPDRPPLPRRRAPRAAGSRGHPPGDQAGAGGERAALHRPPVRDRGAGRGGEGPRRGLQRVRRDVPAVPLPVHRRPRAAGLRGRQVRLLDAAAPQGAPGRAVAGAAHRRPLGGVHRPLPVLLQGAEGAGPRRLLQDPQRAARRRAPDGPAAHRRARRATSRGGAGSRSPAPPRPGCSGSTRARARSRRAPTPTS